jgi:hypothetical protein
MNYRSRNSSVFTPSSFSRRTVAPTSGNVTYEIDILLGPGQDFEVQFLTAAFTSIASAQLLAYSEGRYTSAGNLGV